MSASGSSRWLNCPGSVAAEAGIVDKSSPFADWGTCAHELADICLRTGVSPDTYLGQTLNDAPHIVVDNEIVECVSGYVAYVKQFKGELFSELRVDFSPWVPDGFGTSDAVIIQNNMAHVIDLKTGRGLVVDADNNSQAMLYALGVYNDFGYLFDNVSEFVLHIYQPRVSNFSDWAISLKDLLRWGEWVKLQADLALSDDAERVPGDKQCQWCKAKATCNSLAKFTQEIISAEFDDLDSLEQPNKISKAQLKIILDNKKLITSWLDAVESHVVDLLLTGEKVDGFKMVAGRSVRQWSNEDAAQEAIIAEKGAEAAFERKFISVAKAEKLLGKKHIGLISDYIIKPEGRPTLAPESDNRPSIDNVIDCFENIS